MRCCRLSAIQKKRKHSSVFEDWSIRSSSSRAASSSASSHCSASRYRIRPEPPSLKQSEDACSFQDWRKRDLAVDRRRWGRNQTGQVSPELPRQGIRRTASATTTTITTTTTTTTKTTSAFSSSSASLPSALRSGSPAQDHLGEPRAKAQTAAGPESQALVHLFFYGDPKRKRTTPSGLSFRVIIVPGTESRQEYNARASLNHERRSVIDPVKLAKELATYDEQLWTWERIRRKCMPCHKLKDVPLIVRQSGAPFVFREHEDVSG